MRALLALALLLVLAPCAAAQPEADVMVDDGCSTEGLRVVGQAARVIVVGATVAGHCVAATARS